MRLADLETAGLLSAAGLTSNGLLSSKASTKQRQCGREVARVNELKCTSAIANYGHLRVVELARCVWPLATFGEQMARRTVQRLLRQGLLLERRNALGSKSMCLTRTGAAWLDLRGIPAHHTLDLSSVAGPTFFHRTMATRYLIERQVKGCQVAGEYLILRRKLPFNIDGLAKALQKLPDGLVWQRKADGRTVVEFVEQEAAPKARAEIERCLRAAEYVGVAMSTDGKVRLGGVVFVFDETLNHARRLLLAADSLWSGRSSAERETLERRVKLVAVTLREPLVWVGHSVTTLHELRERRIKPVAIR